MGVFAGRHGLAFLLEGRQQFIGEAVAHGPAAGFPASLKQPADGQTLLPLLIDLHGHLIVGPTHALRAHLDVWLHVVQCGLENFDDRHVLVLLGDVVQGAIDDSLGHALFAAPHQAVDELGNQL